MATEKHAKALAKKGRFGDRHLVHVNDRELQLLNRISGGLHKNPDTGLPEAWNPFSGDFSVDPADALATATGFSVGGVSGADLAHNAVTGQPFTENLGQAAEADVTGLTLGAGVAGSGVADTAVYGEGMGFAGETTTSGGTVPSDPFSPVADPFGSTDFGEGGGFPGETTTSGGTVPGASGGATFPFGLFDGSGILGSGITPMGAFLGLNVLSSGYGLYQAYQLQQERKAQLKRQREYQDKLNALLSNPDSVKNTPGYQFGLDQGTQALQRRMASMGYNRSGNLAVATQRYGTDYATNALTQQEQILAQAYGMSGPSVQYMDPISLVSRSLANLGYGLARV